MGRVIGRHKGQGGLGLLPFTVLVYTKIAVQSASLLAPVRV